MAGPSVVVRVLGDLKGLSKSFTDSGKNAESAAAKAHAAFSTMLGQLNRTGVLGPFGEALNLVDEGFANLAEHGKTVSTVMMGAGGAVAGVGALISGLGSKEQAAHQQLAQAITDTGHSYDDYGKAIDEAIKHNERFGQSSANTQNALQILTQATHDPAEALKLLSTVTDVAAAKHEDLSTAATQVGKVYNGNTKLLKEFGVTVDKNTKLTKDHQTATQALANVVKGQASAASDTFTGKLKALSTTIDDQVSRFGQKYGPALQGAGAALTGLGAAMKITQTAMEAMRGATEAAAASEDVMAASEITAEAAGAPLILILGGIALAVAALVAVGYVLYRNWNTIWAGIKAVAKDVWDWIVGHWPLLLTILLGPIGLAAAEIIKHFSTIKQWAQDVWNWIVAAWHFLYNYLVAPFITALGWFASAWQAIYRFIVTPISTAVGWISGAINTVIGWFDPSKLLAGFDKITGIITAPFRAAFDAIADLWNGTVGSLSFHVPNWVPLIGGKGFDVPKIPKLAQGGLITKEGLVYAHAGEAIIPAPARTGPAVHIEHATFSSQLDIETFMRKTAWYLQTQRV